MHEPVKYSVGVFGAASGYAGWVTSANELAGLICAVLGSVAALITIISWFQNRRNQRKTPPPANPNRWRR